MDVASEVSYLTLAAACLGSIYVTNKDDLIFLASAAIVFMYAVLGALKTG